MVSIHKKICHAFGVFLSTFGIAIAQQDALFSHFFFHNLIYHPGATGIMERTDVSFTYRNQWTGYGTSDGVSGSPISNVLLAETKINAISSGVGLVLMQDQLGPIRNLKTNVNYAYHLMLDAGTVAFGVKLGYQNVQLDPSAWRAAQDNDIRLASIATSDYAFDFSFGGFYQSKTLYGGASLLYLNQPRLFSSQQLGIQYISQFYRHGYVTLGYQWVFNDRFTIIPSFFVRSTQNFDALSFDTNLRLAYLNHRLWSGLSYRLSEGMVAIFGLSLLKNNTLKFSYAFDINLAGRQAKAGTSHEFWLGFSYPLSQSKAKPPIRTPRFRF